MTILFVCTGNTCRSPLAVAAWRSLLAEDTAGATGQQTESLPPQDIEVLSAGLMATSGATASQHSQAVAAEWGSSLDRHSSTSLNEEMVRKADIICTMTRAQAETLKTLYPDAAQKVRTLGEFTAEGCKQCNECDEAARLTTPLSGVRPIKDIADPFGGSLEAYRSCAAEIRSGVAGLKSYLLNNANR